MTTELLLDNSNTISHDNQVSAFKVKDEKNEIVMSMKVMFCKKEFQRNLKNVSNLFSVIIQYH